MVSAARAVRAGRATSDSAWLMAMPSSSTLSSATLTASSANLACLWTAVAVMWRAASRQSTRARWPPRKGCGSSMHRVVLRGQQRRERVLRLQRGELARRGRASSSRSAPRPAPSSPGRSRAGSRSTCRRTTPRCPRAAAPRATGPWCRARPSWPAGPTIHEPPSSVAVAPRRNASAHSLLQVSRRPSSWLRRMRSASSKARWKRGVSTSTLESLSK